MSSGVRNLRAMFENQKAAASPEPRGRSPIDSTPNDSDIRPSPKVRASFVSVEPSALVATPIDLGTTKGTASNSPSAHRRESFSISQDNTEGLAELKKAVSEEKEERRKSTAIPEAIPEQAVASRESSEPAPPIRNPPDEAMPNLGAIMKGSDFPDLPAVKEKPKEKPKVTKAPAPSKQSPVKTKPPTPAAVQLPALTTPIATPAKAKKTVLPEQSAAKADKSVPAPPPPTPAEPSATPAKFETPDPAKVETPAPAKVETPAPAKVETPAPAKQSVTKTEEPKSVPAPAPVPFETPASPMKVEAPALHMQSPVESEAPAPASAVAEPVAAPPQAETEAFKSPAPEVVDEPSVPDVKALPAPSAETPSSNAQPLDMTPKATESKGKANGTPVTKKAEVKKPAAISTKLPSKVASAKSPLPRTPRTPTTPRSSLAAPAPKAVSATKIPAKPAAPKEAVKAPTVKAPAVMTGRTSLRPAGSSAATAPSASVAPKAKNPALENKKPVAARTAPAPKPTTSAHVKPTISAHAKTMNTAPAKTASSAARASTSPGGFKKPRPKSPTRPVGIPSRLTAPTAASAAKHGEEQTLGRKPSTTTRPKAVGAAGRPSRPSVAPGSTIPKRPESRTSTVGAPKGGFLERMMRPTTASASKTHEKPASPPRKATKPVSVIQKGKAKVEEVASKAKAAVTNGHHDDKHDTDDEPAHGSSATDQVIESVGTNEPLEAATQVQEGTSSATELQTSNVQSETIR